MPENSGTRSFFIPRSTGDARAEVRRAFQMGVSALPGAQASLPAIGGDERIRWTHLSVYTSDPNQGHRTARRIKNGKCANPRATSWRSAGVECLRVECKEARCWGRRGRQENQAQ